MRVSRPLNIRELSYYQIQVGILSSENHFLNILIWKKVKLIFKFTSNLIFLNVCNSI